MADKIYTAWEQVTLSPEADGRIRAALTAAQKSKGGVVPLPAGAAVKKHVRRASRTALAAAVTACLLTVSALAAGVIRIALTERQVQSVDMETGETESLTEVGFEPTTESPVLLGVWEMEALPEGFALTDSFYGEGYATATWERPGGGRLDLTYTKGGDEPGAAVLPSDAVREKEDVTVNGAAGVLYTLGQEGDYRLLAWTDEARGVGFTLTAQAGAEDIDLLPLAESVRLTGEKPAVSQKTLDAIAELGDWAPAALPVGYGEYFSQGTPGSAYHSDYTYVRRFYANAAGETIELRCETPVNDSYEGYVANYRTGFERPADAPDAVCSVTDTTVRDLPAGLIEYPDGRPLRLVWLAEDGSVAFLLEADSLTSQELLAVAESVTCLAPATAAGTVPEDAPALDAAGVAVTPEPTERS